MFTQKKREEHYKHFLLCISWTYFEGIGEMNLDSTKPKILISHEKMILRKISTISEESTGPAKI
jgi:hypothetical protein